MGHRVVHANLFHDNQLRQSADMLGIQCTGDDVSSGERMTVMCLKLFLMRHTSKIGTKSGHQMRLLIASKYAKNALAGLCLGPRWEAYSALPDPQLDLGKGRKGRKGRKKGEKEGSGGTGKGKTR